MKRSIVLLVMLSITTTLFSGLNVLAQSSGDPFASPSIYYQLPPGAVLGSSTEAQTALNQITPEKQVAYRQKINDIIQQVRQNPPPPDNTPITDSLAFTDDNGGRQFIPASRTTTQTSQLSFEAGPPSGSQTTCTSGIEQYIRATYQYLFGRQPLAGELANWENSLSTAQTQGTSQLAEAGRVFGSTLFSSAEYTSITRTNEAFVYDLYKIFRNETQPNQSEFNYFVTRASLNGRPYVLGRFSTSIEFGTLLGGLCSAILYDADQDGLSDWFENRVADSFTPYRLSRRNR